MEAGNRCFDQRVPEEINRKIVDHISDINITYSQIAREYLIAEGFPSNHVINAGSPMAEVLNHYLIEINSSNILEELSLQPDSYFLVSAHREENVDDPERLRLFLNVLKSLFDKYGLPIVVSTHPRTKLRLEKIGFKSQEGIRFEKPFGFFDYINLQMNSRCVLSDSGTITEESSILNFPALNLRDVNERPEGFEEGSVMMTGLNFDRIKSCLRILEGQKRLNERDIALVKDYEADNVSKKIVRIIYSYTDYINRRTWLKN
jgi:UDP-N-acetylglucosamine 2-epimerase (non-hydrolysing)